MVNVHNTSPMDHTAPSPDRALPPEQQDKQATARSDALSAESNPTQGMSLRTQGEITAFANLVTAAAVNKRLLVRILAHLENKELTVVHEEVAALDEEFRRQVTDELTELLAPHLSVEQPAEKGALPLGREEERRGHALPNAANAEATADMPLGQDRQERRATIAPLVTGERKNV